MKKWDREQKLRDDKLQTVFDSENIIQNPRTRIEVQNLSRAIALCPFCMYEGPIDKFVISTKRGFHKGLGICPKCATQCQWRNLRKKWTVREFAEWVYAYRADGFWQKVKYQQFNDGLRARGWLEEFWTIYKELKGSSSEETESYSDYIDRSQREEAVEKGWIKQ